MEKKGKKDVFLSIRVTEELREQLRMKAHKNQRTISGQILYYLIRSIEAEELNGRQES
jgi:hypothetical protein